MAALDYNLVLLNAIEAALFANQALADGCKVGSRIFEQHDKSVAQRQHKRAPGDYLEIAGSTAPLDTQGTTVTPTLGLGRATNADTIVPVTCAFDVVYTYDAAQWEKKHPTAGRPEAEGRAALMVGYPRLGGLTYIRSIRFERRRDDLMPDSSAPGVASGGKVKVTERVTFELRLHASQLRN